MRPSICFDITCDLIECGHSRILVYLELQAEVDIIRLLIQNEHSFFAFVESDGFAMLAAPNSNGFLTL